MKKTVIRPARPTQEFTGKGKIIAFFPSFMKTPMCASAYKHLMNRPLPDYDNENDDMPEGLIITPDTFVKFTAEELLELHTFTEAHYGELLQKAAEDKKREEAKKERGDAEKYTHWTHRDYNINQRERIEQ